ncbi:LOW QUALITY PROTEIN: poly [ADP-ribose] polymerase 2 [Fukomys damarensis]|uniref:LOW QUALITY PROTEIN: poly [ADP-ribose] polymerase 2 n=1 Tax=Fukomys damarensis TaxID=885580 RepID=UPI00145572C9|nr:LOW QUALITY PROTEIN: poly [ADP-ribose] polymerase 2 [Fukomys damarensis]
MTSRFEADSARLRGEDPREAGFAVPSRGGRLGFGCGKRNSAPHPYVTPPLPSPASAILNETKRDNNGTTATEDSPPAKKTHKYQRQRVKKEPVAGGKADKGRTEDTQGKPVKSLLLKVKAPVDPECTAKVGKVSNSGPCLMRQAWCHCSKSWPQTNLQLNNKYYLIQLLEDDAWRNFSVWMRWSRANIIWPCCIFPR